MVAEKESLINRKKVASHALKINFAKPRHLLRSSVAGKNIDAACDKQRRVVVMEIYRCIRGKN
jgi:hypothetical protein